MQDSTYVRTYGGKQFYCDSTITAGGNVVANSDERLKTNWRPVAENFVELLASVKYGIYDRVDNSLTQAGVSAQAWQKVLPETVIVGDKGILSVSYGNAALVSAIKLAERVIELEERLKKAGL